MQAPRAAYRVAVLWHTTTCFNGERIIVLTASAVYLAAVPLRAVDDAATRVARILQPVINRVYVAGIIIRQASGATIRCWSSRLWSVACRRSPPPHPRHRCSWTLPSAHPSARPADPKTAGHRYLRSSVIKSTVVCACQRSTEATYGL